MLKMLKSATKHISLLTSRFCSSNCGTKTASPSDPSSTKWLPPSIYFRKSLINHTTPLTSRSSPLKTAPLKDSSSPSGSPQICFSSKSLPKNVLALSTRYYSTKLIPPPDPSAAHRLPPPCSSRTPSPCALPPYEGPNVKPCFDIDKLVVERTDVRYAQMVKSFLRTHYFLREPSLVGLYVPLDSFYLDYLTKYYIYSCKGWLAFEVDPRSGERSLIGMLVGDKKYPWEASKYEKWAEQCCDPERIHMYFHAHCFRSPDVFRKFNVPFVYDIAMLATSSEYIAMGVANLLLQSALTYAIEMRFPLVHMIATNSYMNGPLERSNFEKVWTMKYLDYIDMKGRTLFHPRPPHTEVSVYVRPPHYCDWSNPGIAQVLNKLGKDVECKRKKFGIDLLPPLSKCPTLKPHKK